MNTPPNLKHVIAIGASAGGLEAIINLLSALPAKLAAPIVIAVHSQPASKLAEALRVKTTLPIYEADEVSELRLGTVYVLPGATHGFFKNGKLYLSKTVRDSGFRPSIDALFMTMASEYGDKSIAVVLSGTMTDGMRGAQVIYDMGGETIVQDPEDARFENMPESVINRDHPTVIASASDLGKWISNKVGTFD